MGEDPRGSLLCSRATIQTNKPPTPPMDQHPEMPEAQPTSRNARTSECSDVIGWADSEGYTCAEYGNQSWCTSDGNKGPGWDSGWFEDIEDLWNDGYSAQAACCSCGGGQVEHVSGMWEVMRGPCTVQDGCLLSPNYPADYSVNQSCTFIVNSTIAKPIMVLDWDVEYWNDYVSINGKLFSGSLRPDGEVPNGSIHWVSDENITGRGWKLCPNFTRAAEVNETHHPGLQQRHHHLWSPT
ncbi:unnamed protein product [Effrenium voratum]|nr:unnamed protein product [Effrenium voratum]